MGGLEGVKDKKLLYHLTNVSNMENIIKNSRIFLSRTR